MGSLLCVDKEQYHQLCKFVEVKSKDTALIQQIHNIFCHIICEKVDELIKEA